MPSCKTGGVAETGAQVRAVGGGGAAREERQRIDFSVAVCAPVGRRVYRPIFSSF